MRPLLSEMPFVIVTDLLPKKAIKTPRELHGENEQKIFAHSIHFSIFVQFPWFNEFLKSKEHHLEQVLI